MLLLCYFMVVPGHTTGISNINYTKVWRETTPLEKSLPSNLVLLYHYSQCGEKICQTFTYLDTNCRLK